MTITKVRLLGVFVLSAAISVLVGWYFDITILISIAQNMIAMNPVTALTLSLLGLWLIVDEMFRRDRLRKVARLCVASVVFIVGAVRIAAYLRLVDMRIDRLLFAGKLDRLMVHNAMAHATSFLFILSGIAMMIAYGKRRYTHLLTDVLLMVGFLTAYLGAASYAFSYGSLINEKQFVPMALNTALTLMLVFIGLFLALPAGPVSAVFFSKHTGGVLVRRAIWLVLLVPPAYGYTRLLLQRAQIYTFEYGIALDTGIMVLVVIALLFYYGNVLNKKDAQRKVAQLATLQSEEKYGLLVQALKEGVVYYNSEAKIIFCNPSFAEMTGYTVNELLGRNLITTFVPEEKLTLAWKKMNERVHGITEDYESTILRKDGSRLNVFVTAKEIAGEGNSTAPAFLSTVIDITERKQREEDVEAFSASVAHDLNAPLARIEALNDYIINTARERLNEEDLELLQMNKKISVDMRQLLKDLLLFYKVGVNKISRASVSMNVLVEAVVKHAPESKAIILIDNLPDAWGDAVGLKQVWANLIYNAVKYSSLRDKPRVMVGVMHKNGEIVYYVTDNGAGFDISKLPQMFIPFNRQHQEFEGNGLGLPIVKRIVEKHGGRIWAESEVGKGSTFYFTVGSGH